MLLKSTAAVVVLMLWLPASPWLHRRVPELARQDPESARRTVLSFGGNRCTAWAEVRGQQSAARQEALSSWFEGYLSAWGSALARFRPDLHADALNVDRGALDAWLDAHCRAAPDDTLERAALALVTSRVGTLETAPSGSVLKAWVVWQRTDVKGAKTEWDVIDAVRSLDTCHEVAQHESARLFQGLQGRKDFRGTAVTDVSYDALAIHVRFADGLEGTISNVCLPDTVNPRSR